MAALADVGVDLEPGVFFPVRVMRGERFIGPFKRTIPYKRKRFQCSELRTFLCGKLSASD